MRGVLEKQHPFMQRPSQSTKRQMLQVAYPTMYHPPGGSGCSRPEISFIDQGNTHTTLGGIQGDPGTTDSRSDYQQIKRVVFKIFRIALHVLKWEMVSGYHVQSGMAGMDSDLHRDACFGGGISDIHPCEGGNRYWDDADPHDLL